MEFVIDEMKESDWPQVSAIYMSGIESGIATFQSEVPTWEEWNRSHRETCRFAARKGGDVLGWAALSPVSSRCVYAGVAEVSIYIAAGCRGKGVGTKLLRALVKASEKEGYWTLQSGIIKENTASISLHKKCGFRLIGIRERPARMRDGTWHDVALMERRSPTVGSITE